MAERLRLLLVEDTETDAALIERQLRRAGYEIDAQRVETAEELNAALRSATWDLVVSDYNLPQFDAGQALEMVLATGQDTPFIIVSGTIGEDTAVQMMKRGAHDFILKDNLARLAPAVQREVGEAKVRRERRAAAQELRENQAQLALAAQVFESSSEAIVITDAAGKIVGANKALRDIAGYDPAQVIGLQLQQVALIDDPDRELAFANVALGPWKGEVWCRRENGERFPGWLSLTAVRDEAQALRHYIVVLDDVTEHKASQARIHYLAHYDTLTDLPNRTLLGERMAHVLRGAQRLNEQVAFLFVDLDRFKAINDSLGHHTGDLVLKSVAARLKQCMRDSDTVARVGGDEFVILLPGTGREGAQRVAGKILEALAQPHIVDGRALAMTPSIGISVYPKDGQDAESLIKNADAALNVAKTRGRNKYLFFTQPMSVVALERMELENALRAALEGNQFRLVYQPQVALANHAVVGVEALVRWQHPQMGLISPGRFIGIAEDCGLIVPLGEWILREACRQNALWQQAGMRAIPVSVNVSAVQLKQGDFAQIVTAALRDSRLEARYLELELTETMVMESAEGVMEQVRELSRGGVRFAIDDFGTGYSNLSYLKRFPLARLKIDRSFVQDAPQNEDDAAIVRSIISLAHSLRLTVLAEGVETPEQFQFLRAEQCDEAQGFLLSVPLEAAAVQNWTLPQLERAR